MDKRYFKVLIPGSVRVGAGTTKTFATRAEAEEFIKKEDPNSSGTIDEVDEIGRRIHAQTVGIASAGLVGGIEEYLCTHCWFRSDLPAADHNCYDYGRDDSTAPRLIGNTSGDLKVQAIQNLRSREFLVDWIAEETNDSWRALLTQQEASKLMAARQWGGGEISSLAMSGLAPKITFEMNEQLLRDFAFRHLENR